MPLRVRLPLGSPCGESPPRQGAPTEIGERSREKRRFVVLLFNACR